MPERVLKMALELIPHSCKRCMPFMHAKHRPRVKTLTGRSFNHVPQCDVFFLWDQTFMLLIDECTRYKSVAWLKSTSFDVIKGELLNGWLVISDHRGSFLVTKNPHSLETTLHACATTTASRGGSRALTRAPGPRWQAHHHRLGRKNIQT